MRVPSERRAPVPGETMLGKTSRRGEGEKVSQGRKKMRQGRGKEERDTNLSTAPTAITPRPVEGASA